jgi:hypothetical protein
MLDSGAYSAWAKGEELSVEAYIEFIKQHEHLIDVYINMDSIDDPEKTWDNQRKMEGAGLHPMPVYHIGEPDKYLEMAMAYEYFGLGGMALRAGPVRHEFYERIFTKVCPASNGYLPKNRVHGFGMTAVEVMVKFPFYSVDSTAWVMTSRYGSVFVPPYRGGKWDYTATPWKVAVSGRSTNLEDEGQHFETMTKMEQEVILRYFREKGLAMGKSALRKEDLNYVLKPGERWWGKDESDSQRNMHGDRSGFVNRGHAQDHTIEIVEEPGLSNDYKKRDELNIRYFVDLEKSFPEWPWAFVPAKVGGQGFGLL